MSATKNNIEDTLLNLDNKKELKLVAQEFFNENQDLLEELADRLINYARKGNSLYVNWFAQSLIGLIKQANTSCKVTLGIDESKMQ